MENVLLKRMQIAKTVLEDKLFADTNKLEYGYIVMHASDAEIEKLWAGLFGTIIPTGDIEEEVVTNLKLTAEQRKKLYAKLPLISFDGCKRGEWPRVTCFEGLSGDAYLAHAAGVFRKVVNARSEQLVSLRSSVCRSGAIAYKKDSQFFEHTGKITGVDLFLQSMLMQNCFCYNETRLVNIDNDGAASLKYHKNTDIVDAVSGYGYTGYYKNSYWWGKVARVGYNQVDKLPYGVLYDTWLATPLAESGVPLLMNYKAPFWDGEGAICGYVVGRMLFKDVMNVTTSTSDDSKKYHDTYKYYIWRTEFLSLEELVALVNEFLDQKKIKFSGPTRKHYEYLRSLSDTALTILHGLSVDDLWKKFYYACAVGRMLRSRLQKVNKDHGDELYDFTEVRGSLREASRFFYGSLNFIDVRPLKIFLQELRKAEMPKSLINALWKLFYACNVEAYAVADSDALKFTYSSMHTLMEWCAGLEKAEDSFDDLILSTPEFLAYRKDKGVQRVYGLQFAKKPARKSLSVEFKYLDDGVDNPCMCIKDAETFGTSKRYYIMGTSYLQYVRKLLKVWAVDDDIVQVDYANVFCKENFTLICSEETRDELCEISPNFENICVVFDLPDTELSELQSNRTMGNAFGIDMLSEATTEALPACHWAAFLMLLGKKIRDDGGSSVLGLPAKQQRRWISEAQLASCERLLKDRLADVTVFAGFEIANGFGSTERILWTSAGFLISTTRNAEVDNSDSYICVGLTGLWNFLKNEFGWVEPELAEITDKNYFWSLYAYQMDHPTGDKYGRFWYDAGEYSYNYSIKSYYGRVNENYFSKHHSALMRKFIVILYKQLIAREIGKASDYRWRLYLHMFDYVIPNYVNAKYREAILKSCTDSVVAIGTEYAEIPMRVAMFYKSKYDVIGKALGGVQTLIENSVKCLLGNQVGNPKEFLEAVLNN